MVLLASVSNTLVVERNTGRISYGFIMAKKPIKTVN
jgi:hypothetical protein